VVTNPLVRELGGGHDLDDVEGGPGHVDAVHGGEIRELLERGGFGLLIGGFDLAADLLRGLGDEGSFADELEAHGFDEILQRALEEVLHDRRTRHWGFHCNCVQPNQSIRFNQVETNVAAGGRRGLRMGSFLGPKAYPEAHIKSCSTLETRPFLSAPYNFHLHQMG